MPKWINHKEGVEFLNNISDPAIRGLIEHAYLQIYVNNLSPSCDFDVLFFFQIMEAFLRDKERLANALLGNIDPELRGDDGW